MGCVEHFGEHISIQRENLNAADGTEAKFTLVKVAESVAAD